MVTILADSATHSDKIDEEAALEAKNQAEEALKGADKKEDLGASSGSASRGSSPI